MCDPLRKDVSTLPARITLQRHLLVSHLISMRYENFCVNIRLTHPAFQNTTVFFGAIWYNIPHEIDPATRDLYFRLCAGQCDEHYPLLPTNGGADEAGLYRTQVGSELLASPTRSACGA